MERLQKLFDNFEIELYAQDLIKYHVIIFRELKEMMVNKRTIKRKVGAALLEKILMMFEDRWNNGEGHLLFIDQTLLNFNQDKFLNDFDFRGVAINKEMAKSGYNPITEQNNSIKLKDYIESSFCEIESFNFKCLLGKKENLLFSKNEQKYKVNKKDLKKRERDELDVLEIIDEKISKNQNFKLKFDLKEKEYSKKNNKQNQNKNEMSQNKNQQEKIKRVNIIDIIYDLAKTFIFHNDWELRHGGLIYIRAFSRIFKKGYSIISQFGQPMTHDNFCSLVLFHHLQGSEKKSKQENFEQIENLKKSLNEKDIETDNSYNFEKRCEDIKNRCLILISVDRFSDFLADKSNIINRALASEILVNVFEISPNLTSKLFIFEHLIEKNSEEGWEPKQAVFFFFTQILNAQKEAFEYQQKKNKLKQKKESMKNKTSNNKDAISERKAKIKKNFKNVSENLEKTIEEQPQIKKLVQKLNKKHKNLENLKLMEQELEFETFLKDSRMKFAKGPVINQTNLPNILGFIPQIIEQHEEISEVCCEFLLSILQSGYFSVGNDYWNMVQEKLSDCLFNTEDISYLPKSVFELLNGIISKNILLSDKLKENLDKFFNKFMFHHNIDVRKEIYRFINRLYSLSDENINSPEKIFSTEKIKNLFLTFFFYASLSYINYNKLSSVQDFSPLNPIFVKVQSSKKKKLKQTDELLEISEILSNICNSIKEKKEEILILMLQSLDVFELEELFKLTKASFKFNIENYITEADPQKMFFIVFHILKNFPPKELNNLLENVLKMIPKNSCVDILIGLLSLHYRNHMLFIPYCSYKDLYKENNSITNELNLFLSNDCSKMISVEKKSIKVQYLTNQMKSFIKKIELFLSANFTEGKSLTPSIETQKIMIEIFQLLQKENLEMAIDELLAKFMKLKNNLNKEVQEKKSPLVKTNMVLKNMNEQIISNLKKYNDIVTFFHNLTLLIGGVDLQLELISKEKLPEKRMINKLVLPSINLLSRPIINLFANLVCNNLFLLHLIYIKETKHPNFKIVDTILKTLIFSFPKDNKLCYFFPTPETDEMKFDPYTSLKPCFVRNKNSTFLLYPLKNEISNTPTVLRTEKWLRSTFPQLFQSSPDINFSNLHEKNIFSINLANALNHSLLLSEDKNDWNTYFNHTVESVDSFYFRKNSSKYLFFLNEFYGEELFKKFKKMKIFAEDDHLFYFTYPYLLKCDNEKVLNFLISSHLFNMYFADFAIEFPDSKIENIFCEMKNKIKDQFEIEIEIHACIMNSFNKLLIIFENLNKCNNQTIKLFILIIFDLIKNRQNIGFKFLIHVFKKYKEICISISKIFICEILKSLNDNSDSLDKSLVCESFCLVLTLAYIDGSKIEKSKDFFADEINNDSDLKVEFEKGKKFLFDFKNYQNFEVYIPSNLFTDQLILREYQLEGIKWLNFLWKYELNGILCDDMGLGKTLQSLITVSLQILQLFGESSNNKEIIQMLENKDQNSNLQNIFYQNVCLVVCPNNLVFHWKKECLQRINKNILNPLILNSQIMSSGKFSDLVKKNKFNLFIIGFSSLKKNIDFFDSELAFIVLDEAHMIKNEKSKLAQNIKKIKSKKRLGLTGTPIQNNILELWSIFDFVMPNYLGNKKDFRKEHRDLMNMNMMSLELNKMKLTSNQKRKLEFLHAKVLPFIMRREKKDVLKDLPPKIIQDQQCIMSLEQKQLYEIFGNKEFKKDNNRLELNNVESSLDQMLNDELEKLKDSQNDSKHNILKTLNILRKLVNHPYLLESNLEYSSFINTLKGKLKRQPIFKKFCLGGKFIGLKTILNSLKYEEDDIFSCKNNSNKLIIFSRYRDSCQLIVEFFEKIFPYIKLIHLSNEIGLKERSDMVELFQKDKSIKVIILTTKIGGLGLNLSSANIVIMFDHDFNPMNDLQAIDRAHRIGQKKCVNVFRLIIKDSLEEKIMGIQKFKLSVANTVINYQNATISNVKDANLVDLMKDLAETYQKEVKNEDGETEDHLPKSIHKKLKDLGIEDQWSEDEYDKEFV